MSFTEEELIQHRIAEREARRIGQIRTLGKENSVMKPKIYSPTVSDKTPLDLQSVFLTDIDESGVTVSNNQNKVDPIAASPIYNKNIMSLSQYPIGSLYNKGVEHKSSFLTQEEGKNEEGDKENVIIVKPPPKVSLKESLKKWFTPRKGGKKNKKRNKSKRRRSARK
jgi:hypothetical protein